MHSSVYLHFLSQSIQNGCSLVLSVPYTGQLRELQDGGHQLGPPTALGLHLTCLHMRSSWRDGEDRQLLLGLPNCKSEALLPTSTTWDCKVRMRTHSVDTALTSTFMTQQSNSCYGNRSPTVVFHRSSIWKHTSTTIVFHQSPILQFWL